MRPLNLFKMIKSQSGFSLTEVVVGGGILAGVALGAAQMFKDQKSAQKKIENDQKLALFHTSLNKSMGMASNCNATFKQAGLANSSIPANHQFDTLNGCGSNCKDTNANGTGTAATRNTTLNHKASDVGVGAAMLTRNQYIDGTRTWFVDDIRHAGATARTTSGPVILKVTYKLTPDSSVTNVKKVTKDVIVHTRFHNNQLQECTNAQESSINNLQNDFCKSINYKGTDSTGANNGQFARWDEETQTCILGADKDCTALGMSVDGVDSNGDVKCKPLQRTDDAVYLQDSTAPTVNCANPRLEYTAGKMKMVCP